MVDKPEREREGAHEKTGRQIDRSFCSSCVGPDQGLQVLVQNCSAYNIYNLFIPFLDMEFSLISFVFPSTSGFQVSELNRRA